jgi:hypothetical protein
MRKILVLAGVVKTMSRTRFALSIATIATIFLAALSSSPSASAQTNTVYVSQSGGTFSGGTACNGQTTISLATFNTPGNWTNGTPTGNQIGPGTLVYLCGTITNFVAAWGNGASGNRITIQFDSGAVLAQAAAPGPNFINVQGHSHFLINGGTNGTIENTLNGSTGATCPGGPCVDGANSQGVNIYSATDIEVENLNIIDLYVHCCNTNDGGGFDHTQNNAVKIEGPVSGIHIHNNVFHDMGWSVYYAYGSGDSDIEFYDNQIYNIDHGIAFDGSGSGNSTTGDTIHDNRIYSYANWDASGGGNHHDGIHIYNGPGGTSPNSGMTIYNNFFQGPVGAGITAHIFVEHGSSQAYTNTWQIFNNVAISDAGINNGLFGVYDCESGPCYFLNNTFIGNSNTDGLCYAIGWADGLVMENNVSTTCNTIFAENNNTYTVADRNYNIYANTTGTQQFQLNGTYYATFAAWQAACGAASTGGTGSCDPNGSNPALAGLSSGGMVNSGSSVIDAGTNLTALGIAALDDDTSAGNTRTPTARASSGGWTVGAYTSGSVAVAAPNPPTGLTAAVSP